MALKDAGVGTKILGGLAALALLMALISNGDPDNDAWNAGDPAGASESSDGGSEGAAGSDDAWFEGAAEDDVDLPACDGTAPFSADGGTLRLPVHGPVTPFASAVCRLDTGTGDTDAVRLLQHALAACNGQPVAIDGAYGPETEDAVTAVQARHGIGDDGTYGPETQAAMAWPMDTGEGDGGPDSDGEPVGEMSCGEAPRPR